MIVMKARIFKAFLVVVYAMIDFVILSLGPLASYKLYRFLDLGGQAFYPDAEMIKMSLVSAFVIIVILQIIGAYKSEQSILNVNEIKYVTKGVTLGYMFLAVILVLGKIDISRYTFTLSFILSLVFMITSRTFFHHVLLYVNKIPGWNKRILIYGAGELGQIMFRSIRNSPKWGIVPIGFIDDDEKKKDFVCRQIGFNCISGIRVLGTGKDISGIKDEYNIHEVWVAISNVGNRRLSDILENLRKIGVKICFVPNLYKMFAHKIEIIQIGDLPVAREIEDEKGYYDPVKRGMDIGLAVIALILMWPVFIMIALVIKLDSRGPVLFSHNRVGRNGKLFKMYKFRSMHVTADPYAVNPMNTEDLRITRVGRVIRKISLDELPQVFNVLKGDMSFVGPRPEMPFIVESYTDREKERLSVTPGITGLWQLSGDRNRAIHENLDYDLYYIRNRSFFLDIAILIESLAFAFRGK